jgi:EmrB/QacA subfamily drug resistance transporter
LRLLIPLVVSSGFLMEQLDSTIVATSIPNIADSLHATPVSLNLAITSYILSLAVFIPLSGWVADRFGMRNVICAAFVVFTLGSAACGLAESLSQLVAARIIQGIGGAMMTPVGRLILLRSFPREQLVRAMTFVSIPTLLGPTMGPLLGGVLTTYFSWRWIFYVNLPFGVLAVLIAWPTVSNERVTETRHFDLPGFLICATGLVLLQFALETLGNNALPPSATVAALVCGLLLMAVFVRHTRRVAEPVLDLRLFGMRCFRVGVVAGGITRIAINAPPFLLPLLFQLGFGFSPMESGSLTFVISFGSVAIRLFNAQLMRAFGFGRLLVANAVLTALIIWSFALFAGNTPVWILIGVTTIYGLIRSIQFNVLQMLCYADVPKDKLSRATSLASVLQQLTTGLGVSLSATLLSFMVGPAGVPTLQNLRYAILAVGVLPLLALPGFLTLRPEDGSVVSGYRRKQDSPAAAGD